MLRLKILQLLIPGCVIAVLVAGLRVQIDFDVGIHLIELFCHGIYHCNIAAREIHLFISVPMPHIRMIETVPGPGHNIDFPAYVGIKCHVEGSCVFCFTVSGVVTARIRAALTLLLALLPAACLGSPRSLIVSSVPAGIVPTVMVTASNRPKIFFAFIISSISIEYRPLPLIPQVYFWARFRPLYAAPVTISF